MDTVERGLAAYGYSLADRVIVSPSGKVTGVCVRLVRGRLQVRTVERNTLLWSGPVDSVGRFVEGYWFARPLPTN